MPRKHTQEAFLDASQDQLRNPDSEVGELLPGPEEDQELDLNPPATLEDIGGGETLARNSDGTVEFNFSGEGDSQLDTQGAEVFDANLAEYMTTSERSTLADLIIQFKDTDIESRKDWDRLKSAYMALVGVKEIDTAKLPFPGAARVYHPVLAEAVVQFQSNAIEEFFPATGPVKGSTAGDSTDENEAQTERAADYMNYHLTEEDKGYYADCDQELFTLPFDGSTFKKVFVDPVDGIPKSRFRRADDFIVPYMCTDLHTSPRYIDRYQMTGEEIEQAISAGRWTSVTLPEISNIEGNEVNVRDLSDRRNRVLHQHDRLYTILEAHLQRELNPGVDPLVDVDEDGYALFAPSYVVYTIEETREISCVKRLWDEEDPHFKKEVWFSHKKFLPGLGFYGWGFPHVIGALAEAATGAERAILDSALMATVQGGFRAKDGMKSGEALKIEPGVWKDVDASSEELSKTFYNPPFKEPSEALFKMFQAIVQDARRFASITEVLVGTADNKAPVGTTLALIEQSMKLFTAIHKRIFAAAREEFGQLAKLIYRHGPDQYPYYKDGEQRAMIRTDFDARVDFIPVADPNIISSVQRISLSQAVLELANSRPDLYDVEQMVVIHEEFLKALKVPYWKKIAPKAPKPTYVDAVTENATMTLGKGVRAFPGQAHQMHVILHQQMIMSLQTSLPPDQFEPVYMNAMTHIREHLALMQIEQVSAQMQQSAQVPMPPIDIFANSEDMDPQLEMAITMLAAQMLPPELPPSQLGGPEEQAEAEADPVAEAEARAEALATETMAKIDRETADFAAKQKQDQERHGQELRQKDEKFRLEQKLMDQAAAAEIIRKNAAAIQARRDSAAETAQRMAHAGSERQMKSRLAGDESKSKIELQKQQAAAKPKPKPAAKK